MQDWFYKVLSWALICMVLKQLFPWLPRQSETYRADNKSRNTAPVVWKVFIWFSPALMNTEAKMILIVDTDKQILRRTHWLVWSHTVRGSEVFLDPPSVPCHHTTSFQKRELFFFLVLGNLCSNKILPRSMNKQNRKTIKSWVACLKQASGAQNSGEAVYFPYQEQLEHCTLLHSLLNSSRK